MWYQLNEESKDAIITKEVRKNVISWKEERKNAILWKEERNNVILIEWSKVECIIKERSNKECDINGIIKEDTIWKKDVMKNVILTKEVIKNAILMKEKGNPFELSFLRCQIMSRTNFWYILHWLCSGNPHYVFQSTVIIVYKLLYCAILHCKMNCGTYITDSLA